jgi:hypothetical protein
VFRPAFIFVTTWATSPEEFREKCVRMFDSTVGSCWTLNGRILYRKTENLAKRSKTCSSEQERIPMRSSTVSSISIRYVSRSVIGRNTAKLPPCRILSFCNEQLLP